MNSLKHFLNSLRNSLHSLKDSLKSFFQRLLQEWKTFFKELPSKLTKLKNLSPDLKKWNVACEKCASSIWTHCKTGWKYCKEGSQQLCAFLKRHFKALPEYCKSAKKHGQTIWKQSKIIFKIVAAYLRLGFNYAKLFLLKLWVEKRTFVEFVKDVFLYYRNFNFMKIDGTLLLEYAFKNPYRISKEFLIKQREKKVDVYGETPLTSLELIAKKCRLSARDVVFELGCGRGRTCFWLNCFIGCRVVGIEYVPEFVEIATRVRDRFQVKGVEFRQEDMLLSDFSKATVIYLYGTCLEEDAIRKLMKKMELLPSGAKIITVSYSLTDYLNGQREPFLELMSVFPVEFTWGKAEVFLHYRK